MIHVTQVCKRFTGAELEALLAKGTDEQRGEVPREIRIAQLRVGSRTSSGRADTIVLTGSDQRTYSMPATQFRYLTQVRSTLFDVRQQDSAFVFEGKGWGHGVGMAQQGAYEYVTQLQWSYEQILKFYYTGAILEAQ